MISDTALISEFWRIYEIYKGNEEIQKLGLLLAKLN